MSRSRTDTVRIACLALVAAAGLPMLGGCGPGNLTEPRDIAELQKIVSTSAQPVLVDYYKGGCENCRAFEVTLGALAEDYKGRIRVLRFLLKNADGSSPAPEFAAEHEILVFPTVLIYVGGQEKKRFEQQYKYNDYEKAINECLGAPTTRQAATQQATTAATTHPDR
jgi:thioredoxin 1